ncbi:MAG: hypothetical protein HXX81_02775, partial [Campylobacterales bacterium]|nr:hypothetical protein [Campylobacterales bacterium]
MFFKNKNFQISFFSFGMPIIIYLLMIKLNMLLADPKMSDYWALGEHFYNFWSFEGFGYTVRTYPASLYQAVLRFIVGGDIYYALFLQTLIYCLSLYYFIKAYFDLIPKWAFLLIGSSPLLMYILNTYNAEPLQLTLYLFMLAVGKKFIDTKQTKYFIIMLFFGSLMYA